LLEFGEKRPQNDHQKNQNPVNQLLTRINGIRSIYTGKPVKINIC